MMGHVPGRVWGMTPKQSVERECAGRGTPAVVAGCVALLSGGAADDGLISALGGPGAPAMVFGPHRPGFDQRYWLRVWGARGLLYAWDEGAADAVLRGLDDEHWRVREMSAKVIARRRLGDALPRLAGLRDDPVPRVRAAAMRAAEILVGHRA
jgi:hypothetical protein